LSRRFLAELVHVAPEWIWRPGNLRMVGDHTIHFCYGNGRRTVELDEREVIVGRRMRVPPP
jgi:hypothetical protein